MDDLSCRFEAPPRAAGVGQSAAVASQIRGLFATLESSPWRAAVVRAGGGTAKQHTHTWRSAFPHLPTQDRSVSVPRNVCKLTGGPSARVQS